MCCFSYCFKYSQLLTLVRIFASFWLALDISTVLFEKTTLHYDYNFFSKIWSAIGKSVVVKWTLRIDSYIFFNILLNSCISFQVNNYPLLLSLFFEKLILGLILLILYFRSIRRWSHQAEWEIWILGATRMEYSGIKSNSREGSSTEN